MIAIPTTSGTGSEATLASVISNPKTKRKYAVMDHRLIPNIALLDASLTAKLPANLTAYTGMDALAHAVEAYINIKTTSKTDYWAKQTVQRVHRYLLRAYHHPEDWLAREGKLEAAFDGDRAFTRAYVGNVHVMSHALTAFYDSPHGLTNAILLPHVLRYYGKAVDEPLSELADAIGLLSGQQASQSAKAAAFIDWIDELNQALEIPAYYKDIRLEDLQDLAEQAENEANPLYPVPVIFKHHDFVKLYDTVRGA